jgi:DNA-binding transcriptional MocR family regulator
MAWIATRWIEDGTAETLVAEKRAETARRQEIVSRLFVAARIDRDPVAAHFWVTLPEEWRAEDFTAAAEKRGVSITPAAAFAATRHAPNAVRICIGAPTTAAEVESGLTRLAGLLQARPDAYLSVV